MNILSTYSFEEAIKEAERKREFVDTLMPVLLGGAYDGRLNDNAAMVGRSLIDHVIDICETLLTAVCWDYASPEGWFPFPKLADLFPGKSDCPVPFTPETGIAAGALTGIRKENTSNKKEPDAALIAKLLVAARDFIKGISDLVKGEHRELASFARWIEDVYESYDCRYRDFTEYERHLWESGERKRSRKGTPMRFETLYFPKGTNEEDLTEEELDEAYKIRNKNSDKHIAPTEIYELFRNAGTSRENRIGVNEVMKLLEEKCGIKMERKAVARTLTQLQEADFLCKVIGEKGYWYDEELVRKRSSEYRF